MEERRQPPFGNLRGEFDVLGTDRRNDDGDAFADRSIDQLQWLAQPRAPTGGERDRVVLTLVDQRFPPPYLAADVDDLAGAGQRRVIHDPVKPFDHLWTRCADAKAESPVGYVVESSGGHRGETRRSGVDLQNPGGHQQPIRARRDVTELADRVERIGFRDVDDVKPGTFQIAQSLDGLPKATAVREGHPDSHGCSYLGSSSIGVTV